MILKCRFQSRFRSYVDASVGGRAVFHGKGIVLAKSRTYAGIVMPRALVRAVGRKVMDLCHE